MSNLTLLVSDKKYISSDIFGGVQLCTHEYIKYIKLAGYDVKEFHVKPSISLAKRIKIKLGIDAYDHYDIAPYIIELAETINSHAIKLVFFNQISLSFWAATLKKHVAPDVKFIGLSHGSDSGDYVHDITQPGSSTILQRWKLGQLLVKEHNLFASMLDGVIVLSEHDVAINQWLGANNILFLPRLLEAGFITWQPTTSNAGFVGTLDHLPNLLGIKQLAKELELINFQYKLRLVGGPASIGEQLAKQYDFIQYLGPISDQELVEQIKTWSVFLNPVFWYARGSSTKLAQAINWGIPCLTTPAGKRGYHLHNEMIVTADNSPKTFAKTLVSALSDKEYLLNLKNATEDNASTFKVKPYVNALNDFLTGIVATER